MGVSASSPFPQKTFADSLKLPYPLLSDHPDLKVIRSYAVVQPSRRDPNLLLARRSFFLIDSEGIIRGKWFPEKQGDLFPSEPILEKAREIAGKL
ncbi:MAG: redoxin domain-containing protein [Nitrospinae bacterium]|nr:redoxin domain-containing protein [Nitrospinota bacterium]